MQRARCARTSIQNIKGKWTKRTLAAKSNLTLTAFHQNGFASDISILQTSHRQTHTTDAVVQRKCAAKPPRRQTLQNNRECSHIVKICRKASCATVLPRASQYTCLYCTSGDGPHAPASTESLPRSRHIHVGGLAHIHMRFTMRLRQLRASCMFLLLQQTEVSLLRCSPLCERATSLD